MKKITRKEFIRLLETSAIAVGSILITGCANSSKSPSSGTHLFGDSVNFNGIQIIFSLWNQKDVPNTPAYSNYQNQKIISMYLFVKNHSENTTWTPCSTRNEYQSALDQRVEDAFSLKSGFSCKYSGTIAKSTSYADKCLDPDIATVVTNITNQFSPKESGTILVQTIVPSNWKQLQLNFCDQLGSFSYLLNSSDPSQIIGDTYD